MQMSYDALIHFHTAPGVVYIPSAFLSMLERYDHAHGGPVGRAIGIYKVGW